MNLGYTEPEWLIQDPVILDFEVAWVRFGPEEDPIYRGKIGFGGKKFSELKYNINSGGDNNDGSTTVPLGQVGRYKRFKDVKAPISVNGLFNQNNSLLGVYIFRKTGGEFSINVSTSAGKDLGTYPIKSSSKSLNITELFEVDTNVTITGFDNDHICDVLVLYNSFQLGANGEVPSDIITELRAEMQGIKEELLLEIENLGSLIKEIPSGVVAIWRGGINNIPEGWSLFTGFKDRFVIGAGGLYQEDQPGGVAKVKLTIGQLPKHRFQYVTPNGEGSATGNKDSHPDGPLVNKFTDYIGNDEEHENMPPYIGAVYIIKD